MSSAHNRYSAIYVVSYIGEKMAAERFKQVTTLDVHHIINNAIPENTKKATKFSVKIFKS